MLDTLPTCLTFIFDRVRDRVIDLKPIEPASPIVITAIPIKIKPVCSLFWLLIGGRDRAIVGSAITTLIGVAVGAGVIVMPGAGVEVGGKGVGVGGGCGSCNSP